VLKALSVCAGLAVAAVVAAPLAYPHVELAPLWYPVVGIDVSNHQGVIDWDQLATSGVAFAYIKATEGSTFRDKSFARNWSEAKRVGIPRGAYHFFRLCRPVAEQAQNFIAAVPKEPGALPHVVDAEDMGPCAATPTPSDHAALLDDFLDQLERHYGRRPLIYTTSEFDSVMLEGAGLAAERFWARSLVLPPRYRTREWVVWQYHNRGRRPGVKGDLDLNVFRGNAADFARFAGEGAAGY